MTRKVNGSFPSITIQCKLEVLIVPEQMLQSFSYNQWHINTCKLTLQERGGMSCLF